MRALPYHFRNVTENDAALLASWRNTPHVSRWWDVAGDDADAGDEDELGVSRWIVEHDGRPFAYMQDYDVHAWPDHHFGHLPLGSRGIDQFIGEADMIGMGHGTAFIAQRMRALFRAGVPVIATDPHPDNARAIAVYEKVGFTVVGTPIQTPWGLVLPMEARIEDSDDVAAVPAGMHRPDKP